MLSILIPDLLNIIFHICSISDKRNLIRSCKSLNSLTKLMPQIEIVFQKMINNTEFMEEFYKFTRFNNPLYKYTIELIYDGYAHLIPERYIIPENRIMHYYGNIYYQTAKKGNLAMLQLLLRIENPPNLKSNIDELICGAARGGHKNILEWISNKYKLTSSAAEYAAKGNYFELLKWLYHKNVVLTNAVNSNAIKTANTTMIKWVFDRNSDDSDYSYYAVKSNTMELIEWLHEKYPSIISEICNNAIEFGNLEMLKWGLQHNYKINYESLLGYVQGGHIKILEWLIKNGHIRYKNDSLTVYAAFHNKFDTLKWAYENGFPLTSEVTERAADNGNIEMLKWCKDRGGC